MWNSLSLWDRTIYVRFAYSGANRAESNESAGIQDCLDAGRDFLAAAGVSGVLHTKLDFSLVARRNRRKTVDLTAALHEWTGGSNSIIAWVTKKNGSRCESYNCKLPGLCRFE